MGRSRRAITPLSARLLQAIGLCSIGVIFLATLFWFQTQRTLAIHGTSLLAQRLSNAFKVTTNLEKVSLSFPNHLQITNLSLAHPQNPSQPFLKVPQVEVKLLVFSFIRGIIRPDSVRLVAPHLQIPADTTVDMWQSITSGLSQKVTSPQAQTGFFSQFKPLHWPLEMVPMSLEVINGQAHIEDESDQFPTFEGQFDFKIKHLSDHQLPGIGLFHIPEGQFFFRGLHGNIRGSLTITEEQIFSESVLAVKPGHQLNLRLKCKKKLSTPEISFKLDIGDYDLKNFAMLRYPFPKLSQTTNVTGIVYSQAPILYGVPFQSFSASAIHTKGNWHIDTIDLQLNRNRGTITGSIVSPVNDHTGIINIQYRGVSIPEFQFHDDIADDFAPFFWQSPYTMNTEISLDDTSYPLLAKTIKITSSHGDYFAQGVFDLFSGYFDMEGTFLLPKSIRNETNNGLKQSDTLSISLTGPLTKPLLARQKNRTENRTLP